MFKTFISTLIFGVVIGLSSAVYLMGLDWIQHFHQSNTVYPYFLIVVFAALFLVKRNTLYFPITVHAVVNADETEQKHWSPFSFLWNLIGSWLSHLVGASLGREGTTLVLASSLAQVFKLNWNYFKPIILSAALASVFGQPLVALAVNLELFNANYEQKIYSLMMAWIGVLVLQTLGIQFLFSSTAVNLSAPFFDKLLVAVILGVVTGLTGRYFKKGYHFLSPFFAKNKWISALVVLILTLIILWPGARATHSLSLDTFLQVQNGQADLQFIILKTLLTLLFVSLGFIGGDFVPLVIVGSSLGVLIAHFFKVDHSFGYILGLLALFTTVSRLKWSSLCLILLIAGFFPALWAYITLSLARYISGSVSLYKH